MRVEDFQAEIKRHKENIIRIERAIAKLPEGKLSHSVRNGRDVYRVLRDGKYVSVNRKKEKDYLDKLIVRSTLECRLRDEKKLLEIALSIEEKYKKLKLEYDEYLSKHLDFENVLKDYYNENDEKYENLLEPDAHIEPHFKENLKIRTIDGTCVRSKSECMIYNALHDNGFTFKYERATKASDKIYLSDFAIVHPKTKKLIIWEHLGMLDNPEYLRSSIEKIINYVKAGYIPGVNLIITYETKDKVLDSQEILKVIDLYLK